MSDYRNPHRNELVEIARNYARRIRQVVDYCDIVLGGSLVSNTAPIDHNDIDMRLLAPKGRDDNNNIRLVSKTIERIAPFCKEYEKSLHFSHLETFEIMNRDTLEHPIGNVTVEVCTIPEWAYIGLGVAMLQLPKTELDIYVEKKFMALKEGDKKKYKEIKVEMYERVLSDLRSGKLQKSEPFRL